MNMHSDVKKFSPSFKPRKVGLLMQVLNVLATILSGPKGDQSGWEAGARGF